MSLVLILNPLTQQTGVVRAITGQTIASSTGTFKSNVAVSLSGQVITSTAATTGYKATISEPISTSTGMSSVQGTGIVPTLSSSLIGQVANSSQGPPVPSVSYTLTGQSITSSVGTLDAQESISDTLTGQVVSTQFGSVTTSNTVTLTGIQITSSVGTLNTSEVVSPTINAYRTNWISSSTFQGIVAGNPGTQPNGSAWFGPAGLTRNIIGTGVDSTTGLTYYDVQLSYTNSLGTIQSIGLDPVSNVSVSASEGQIWTSSAYFALISGSWPTSTCSIGTVSRSGAGAGLGNSYQTIKGVSSTLQRVSSTWAMTSGTVYVQTVIRFDIAPGDSINITIRVAAPQLEMSAAATAFIPTSSGSVSAHATTATTSIGSATTATTVSIATQLISSSVYALNASEFVSPTLNAYRTNLIPNSTMQGATSSTLPTGWASLTTQAGISAAVVGVGTDSTTGLNYIDVRFNGTSTGAGGGLRVIPVSSSTSIVGTNGLAVSNSVYLGLVAGQFPIGRIPLYTLYPRNAVGTAIGSPASVNLTSIVTQPNLVRVAYSTQFNYSDLAYIQPFFEVAVVTNDVVDFTLRFAAPQLEYTGAATTFIPTSSGSVSSHATTAVSSIGTASSAIVVTLTGQSITTDVGTVDTKEYIENTAVGQSITSSIGTVSTATNVSIATQLISSSVGTASSNNSVTASSQLITSSIGSLDAQESIKDTLTGQVVTTSTGTVTSSNNVSVSTQLISSSVGSVPSTSNVVTLTGIQITSSLGNVSTSNVVTLTGIQITSSLGNVSTSGSTVITLTGQSISSSVGSVTTTYSGLVTLTGRSITSSIGTVNTSEVVNSNLSAYRTNYVLNSTMQGAVAGTPGTSPTNWVLNINSGITRQIVGTGVDPTTGLTYIDIRHYGTATTTSYFEVQFVPNLQTVASIGQVFTTSVYLALVAGSLYPSTGGRYSILSLSPRTAGGAAVGGNSIDFAASLTSSLSRYSVGATCNDPATAFIGDLVRIGVLAGDVVDCTLRIAAPQLESSAAATAFIPTYGSAVSDHATTAVSSLGSVNTATTVAVLGQQITSSIGSLDAQESISDTLTGQVITSSVGSVSSNSSVTLTGQSITSSVGTLAANETTQVTLNSLITNLFNNSTMLGAVVGVIGSGGSLPTGWTSGNVSGITKEIVAVGVDSNNESYLDYRISGTNLSGSTAYPDLYLGGPMVAAVFGETYTASCRITSIAGSRTGLSSSSSKIALAEWNSSGAYLAGQASISSDGNRISVTRTLSNTSVAKIGAYIDLSILAGNSVDYTFRVSIPQLEKSNVLNVFVPTTTSAASVHATTAVSSSGSVNTATTVTLIGQSITSSIGSVTFATGSAVSITNQVITSSIGSVTRTYSGAPAVTNQTIASSVGAVTTAGGDSFKSITSPTSLTSSIGSISTATTVALTGYQITSSTTNISSNENVSVSLSGLQVTSSVNSVSPYKVINLTGFEIATSVGVVTTSITNAISAQSIQSLSGTVSSSPIYDIVGTEIVIEQGTIQSTDVSVSIEGLSGTLEQGILEKTFFLEVFKDVIGLDINSEIGNTTTTTFWEVSIAGIELQSIVKSFSLDILRGQAAPNDIIVVPPRVSLATVDSKVTTIAAQTRTTSIVPPARVVSITPTSRTGSSISVPQNRTTISK